MNEKKEIIKVTDKMGFHYEVTVIHIPHLGFSNALYNEVIIGQVELGKIREPISDDEEEWEVYEERFCEWKDEIKTNLVLICIDYFNSRLSK